MAERWPILLMVRQLHYGGCERDLTRIATGLDPSRFEVHVGCFDGEGFRRKEIEAAGIPVTVFPVRSFASPSVLQAGRVFGEYVRRHRIRLVHAYDYPTALFAAPAGKFYRVPAVIISQLSYRALRRGYEQWMLRICDRLADIVVVNCHALERHMTQDEGVPASRLYLCYNGVDTSVFYPAPRPAGSRVVIGSVCVLRPEKRIDLLLDAFARVRAVEPGVELVIVGDGPLLAPLERQRDALGLGDSCRFVAANANVAEWLRRMDIFVLPSSSEAFSNALLEAMACGCAPVGSRVGGMPELIEHGQRGFLFESGNVDDLAHRLTELVRDAALRGRFSEAAAAFARETLPMERAVATMARLYERMLKA
jgi:glycosyltransferase involved in cell wall biosynthesis